MAVLEGLGWVGIEPTTNALKGRCSTIELPTRKQSTEGYSLFSLLQPKIHLYPRRPRFTSASARASSRLSLFDHSIRVVVVDRFVILGFDAVPGDTRIGVRLEGDASHQILHKYRVLVRPLGYRFFVRAL
jgi:hypothetical protein